ncbi:MAG: aminoacyl-tRNA hydrolase [Clostridia bacterium]|nr:aminoacyl-tRNA hydrolase [Clostridia bacterium]
MAFFRKKKESATAAPPVYGPVEYLIVGLGNPGKDYAGTRHNAGFMFVEILCKEYGFEVNRLKFRALCGETMISGKRCLVMLPQTYMNLSGDAVIEAAKFYKIPPERIVVIFDDISLPFGVMRIRRKGSAGGHNGLKSIIYQLASDEFPRIKIGVGDRADREDDLKDYVLGKFGKTQLDELKTLFADGVKALELIVDGRIDDAMSRYSK